MAITVYLCAAGEKDPLHGEHGLLTDREQLCYQELGRRLVDFNQVVVSEDPHAVHSLLSMMQGRMKFGPVKTIPEFSGNATVAKFEIKRLVLDAQDEDRILIIMPAERLCAVCQAFVENENWTQEFEPCTIARLTLDEVYVNLLTIEYDSNPREAAPPCSP